MYLEKADDFDLAVHDLIKKYATEHQRIVFNGNGYSDEWVAEAERRGLPNIKSMVEAIPALTTEKAINLCLRSLKYLQRQSLSHVQRSSMRTTQRQSILKLRTMIDMASKQIIPAVIKYTKELADTINAVKAAGVDVSVQSELLTEISCSSCREQRAL